MARQAEQGVCCGFAPHARRRSSQKWIFHGDPGCDVVEMVLADQDSWDRYVAAQWFNVRRWLDDNPDDEMAEQMRAELSTAPARHARYQREYLGWGVFALMNRRRMT